MELLGEGPTRRIHLTVLAFLTVSGIALQVLAWWYRVQAIREEVVCRGSAGLAPSHRYLDSDRGPAFGIPAETPEEHVRRHDSQGVQQARLYIIFLGRTKVATP